MKYGCIYCLRDLVSDRKYYFSTEILAFEFADSKGFGNFTVEVIRYCYDLAE